LARAGASVLFRRELARGISRRIRPQRVVALLKVFMPYLVWDTVFDNSRVVGEMGRAPESFSRYCYPLLRFSRDCRFSYPYQEWPTAFVPVREDAAAAGVGRSGGFQP